MILARTPAYTLYIASVEPSPLGPRYDRRRREEAAVAALLREAFGPDAERRHDSTGAPVAYVAGAEISARISLSHSVHHAVLAVAAPGVADIGVDIEEPREALARVVCRILSPDEQSLCRTDADRLRAWTLKEALYKASRRHFAAEPAYDTDLPLTARAAGHTYTVEHLPHAEAAIAVVWR